MGDFLLSAGLLEIGNEPVFELLGRRCRIGQLKAVERHLIDLLLVHRLFDCFQHDLKLGHGHTEK